jgi:hypothetical protein
MRFPDWPGGRVPQLLDVILQTDGPGGDPDEVRRAYEVCGVVETRTGYRLLCERIEYGAIPVSEAEDALWCFWNLPRR